METLNPNPTTDWHFCVSYLHWSGLNNKVLTAKQQQEVRKLGDGFGKGITDPNLIWDWSHVRDSSPEAVTAMANKIKELAGVKG
jgi:hypothetical protein